MGTNYFLEINKCSCCGRSDILYIGKSSAGWKFMFQKIPNKAENFEQWCDLLIRGEIIDEYGRHWSLQKFLDLVKSKQKDRAQLYQGMELVNGFNFMEGDFS